MVGEDKPVEKLSNVGRVRTTNNKQQLKHSLPYGLLISLWRQSFAWPQSQNLLIVTY